MDRGQAAIARHQPAHILADEALHLRRRDAPQPGQRLDHAQQVPRHPALPRQPLQPARVIGLGQQLREGQPTGYLLNDR